MSAVHTIHSELSKSNRTVVQQNDNQFTVTIIYITADNHRVISHISLYLVNKVRIRYQIIESYVKLSGPALALTELLLSCLWLGRITAIIISTIKIYKIHCSHSFTVDYINITLDKYSFTNYLLSYSQITAIVLVLVFTRVISLKSRSSIYKHNTQLFDQFV